jgi:hypothetical protein
MQSLITTVYTVVYVQKLTPSQRTTGTVVHLISESKLYHWVLGELTLDHQRFDVVDRVCVFHAVDDDAPHVFEALDCAHRCDGLSGWEVVESRVGVRMGRGKDWKRVKAGQW